MHSKHDTTVISPPVWDDRLLFWHLDIDRDHKSLFAIAARIFTNEMSGVSYSLISDVLAELADYTSEHFGHEELLMDQVCYPNCAERILQHIAFIQKPSIMIDTYERHRVDVLPELHFVLFDCLLNHISDDNRKFGDFLKSRNPSVKNAEFH